MITQDEINTLKDHVFDVSENARVDSLGFIGKERMTWYSSLTAICFRQKDGTASAVELSILEHRISTFNNTMTIDEMSDYVIDLSVKVSKLMNIIDFFEESCINYLDALDMSTAENGDAVDVVDYLDLQLFVSIAAL